MEKMLKGKVALVTGGSRGIGKAIVLALLREGARVVFFGLDAERGAQMVRACEAEEGSLLFHAVDVGDREAVERAIQLIYEREGILDILVNNAGITRDQLLMRLSEEDWDEVIRVNLKSLYNTCRVVARAMMKAQGGRIINISSVIGLFGNAGQTAYAASKAGMIGFTKSLAKEVGRRGVLVNCVAPGFITTDMTEALEAKQKAWLLERIPMQSFGTPEDVADAVVFLASPLAKYITGQVLVVDGGMAM